jgi:hypothetical protein
VIYEKAERGTERIKENIRELDREISKDHELCTIRRYANTKKDKQERYKAWFSPVEQAEYYNGTTKRSSGNACGRKEKAHGPIHIC